MRISTRLILLLVVAVVTVMAGYAVVTISRTRESLDEEMRKMGMHMGVSIGLASLHHLESGDIRGIQDIVENLSRDPDVVGAAIFGRDGKLLGASSSLAGSLPDSEQVYRETVGIYRVEPGSDHTRYTYIRGIQNRQGDVLGSLRLVLRERSMLPEVIRLRNQVLWATLILTGVLALIVTYVTRRQIGEPLRALVSGVEAVGRGELHHRIKAIRNDEVGVVGAAFNRMAENLEVITVELTAEREYVRRIIDSLPDAIFVANSTGHLRAWNRTMSDLAKMDLEDIFDRDVRTVLGEIGLEQICPEVEELVSGRRDRMAIQQLTMGERTLVVTGSRMRSPNQEESGGVVILTDVTERVGLEKQIQRSERLAAVGQLAAGVAHEIGTPLNVISASAEFLMAGQKGSESAELKTIVSEVDRITSLVKRLMSLARQPEAARERVELGNVILDVLVLLRSQLERAQIVVVQEVDDDIPTILASRDEIVQVVLNLVINAWHAMPDGGRLSVRVTAPEAEHGREGDDSRPMLSFVVEDTGTGIASDDLERVFEPFYTTKDVGQGTGLGLSIVHRIVEDHGGRITVRSEPGHGTVFEILLPIDSGPTNA